MHRYMLGRDWLQLSISLWQQPSHPPSNSLFLMLWWFSASQGPFFCSIQRGNHGNGSLTLGVLLQLLQAWPEFVILGRHTWLGQLTCFSLSGVKQLWLWVKASTHFCSWISNDRPFVVSGVCIFVMLSLIVDQSQVRSIAYVNAVEISCLLLYAEETAWTSSLLVTIRSKVYLKMPKILLFLASPVWGMAAFLCLMC